MRFKALPTLRKKLRYIKFRLISERRVGFEMLERAMRGSLLMLVGELGLSRIPFALLKQRYDARRGIGVVRCDSKSVNLMLAALGLIGVIDGERVVFRVLRVSGTVKGLEKI
jgi:RNase P/RNase MRP subunit POP5